MIIALVSRYHYSSIYIMPRHPTMSARHLFQPVRRSPNAVAPIAVCGRTWSVSGSVAKLGARGLTMQTVMQHYNRRSITQLISPAFIGHHSFHHLTYQESNLKPLKHSTNFFSVLPHITQRGKAERLSFSPKFLFLA
jgi:hypothetical protein